MHSDVLSAAVAGTSPSFDQALSVMVESRRDSSELLEAAGRDLLEAVSYVKNSRVILLHFPARFS